MTSHARPQPTPSFAVAALTVAAVAFAVARAAAPSGVVTTVLVLVALGIGGVLGAIVWRPRGPLVVGHVAAALVTILTALLVCGFVLAAIQVDLDTRSTSIYFAIIALLLGGGAMQRRRQASVEASAPSDDLPVDDVNGLVPTELDDAVGAPSTPWHARPVSRLAVVSIAAVVAVLAAAGIVLSFVSDDKLTQREAFVALSTVSSKADAQNQRLLTIQVSNHRESQTGYNLDITGGAVARRVQLTVQQDTSEALRIRVPAAAKVTVKLYRNDRPDSVYRQTVSLPPAGA